MNKSGFVTIVGDSCIETQLFAKSALNANVVSNIDLTTSQFICKGVFDNSDIQVILLRSKLVDQQQNNLLINYQPKAEAVHIKISLIVYLIDVDAEVDLQLIENLNVNRELSNVPIIAVIHDCDYRISGIKAQAKIKSLWLLGIFDEVCVCDLQYSNIENIFCEETISGFLPLVS